MSHKVCCFIKYVKTGTRHMISLRALSGIVKILAMKISPDKSQSVFTDVDETAEGLDRLLWRGSIVRELQITRVKSVGKVIDYNNIWEALCPVLSAHIPTYDLLQHWKIIWKQSHIKRKLMYTDLLTSCCADSCMCVCLFALEKCNAQACPRAR